MAKQQRPKPAQAPRRRGCKKAALGRANPLGKHKQVGVADTCRKAPAEPSEKSIAASALPDEQSATVEPQAKPAQRKRRRKQVRLSVAMRKIGLDEYMVAESLAGLIEKLGTNRGEAKVLLDALKESTRLLDPPKAYRTSESDGPNHVVLRHDVPRPDRNCLQEQNAMELGAG